MKKSLLCICLAIVSTKLLATPLVFDDGGTYSIDYTITDSVEITNHTTVNVNAGANISGLSGFNSSALYGSNYSTVNIYDGLIRGKALLENNVSVSVYGGSIDALLIGGGTTTSITGGDIDQFYVVAGGVTANISGGSFNDLFSEAGAHLNISDGSFGSITTLNATYDITGGIFSGGIAIDAYRSSVVIDIKGGTFLSGFQYAVDPFGGAGPTDHDSYVFYGNLTLATPTLIDSGNDFNTYQTTIFGTLMDGSAISQSIICQDRIIDNDPCGGVAIISSVPLPPALYLFASGLLCLAGITRRKKAA